eukprot:1143399-Pelagomonas_calceolata.AAC.1
MRAAANCGTSSKPCLDTESGPYDSSMLHFDFQYRTTGLFFSSYPLLYPGFLIYCLQFSPPCAGMYQHQACQPNSVAAGPFFKSVTALIIKCKQHRNSRQFRINEYGKTDVHEKA